MSNWKTVRLEDVCRDITVGYVGSMTKEYVEAGIPFLRSQNVLPFNLKLASIKYISPTFHEKLKKSALQPGDVVVVRTGNAGAACVIPPSLPVANCSDLVIFRPSTELDGQYLACLFNSTWGQGRVTGNLVGQIQQHFNIGAAREMVINLPPLPEQERIVAIAQKADRLRRTRRYALQLSDTFLQSVFLEMFADPVTNPKTWELWPLNKLCTNITDGTHDTPDRLSSGIPFITSKNIRPYRIDLTDLEFVSLETHKEIIKRSNPKYGDILYTNIGVNVGNAVANKLRFSFSLKNVALLQPNHKTLNYLFLESLLNNEIFKSHIITITSIGGAQKFISLEVLRNISVIKPPLPLQEKFAQIVQKFERLRTQQREAERQAEHLFQTLLHRAFRGELTPQHPNDEPASVLLEQIGAEQAQTEAEAKAATQAMGDAAEYLGTKAKQQDTEPIQLKLPGME
jgi:type I restriction enzyme S subunit